MAGLFTTVSTAISGAIDEELAEAQGRSRSGRGCPRGASGTTFETYVEAYADVRRGPRGRRRRLQDPGRADFTDPEVLAALQEAGAIFNDPELTEATNNISAFFASGCEG